MLSAVLLNVVQLMPSVVILSVVMLHLANNPLMPSVVMLNVIMLSVVEPKY